MSDTHEAIKGEATPNKGTLQSYVQNFTMEAVDKLVSIMRTSRNEALAMGAAKILVDKSIPDIKAVEHSGTDGGDIVIRVIKDGIPTSDREFSEAESNISEQS